jgi:nucleotide-binding universal stress UspA family protein
MYRKILVGYDGSEGATRALRQAATLAKHLGSELCVLWVRDPLPQYAAMMDEVAEEKEAADLYFEELSARVKALTGSGGVNIDCVSRFGHPAQTIVKFAEEKGFDLIVLGHAGHSGLWGRFLGHTADRISEHASCSVLIVREK